MKIVIILVNLFFIACVNADTLEQYHLTIFKNNGNQFADGTIYLPSRLEVTFSGEVKCEGVGSQFDICNLDISSSKFSLDLSHLISDGGLSLSGKIINDQVEGVVVIRSYGPYEDFGTFKITRK